MSAAARIAARAGALSAGLLALAVLWLALLAPSAAAHALLLRASPGVNSTVASSPSRILLTFTEPVVPTLSSAQLVDMRGAAVPGAARSTTVAGNASQLVIVLSRRLPHGVYTVDWQTVSAVDGHYVTGAFAFGVGVADVGTVAPFGKFVSTSPWLIGAQSVGRWLLYVGLALLAGCAVTCRIVFRGRLPAGGQTLLWVAWLLGAAGVSIVIMTERAIVGAPALLPLFETVQGLEMLGEGTAVIVVCGLAVTAAGALPHRVTLATLAGAAAIAMFSVVWLSHADVPSPFRPVNVALQWLHFAAVGAWVGGFAWLLLGLRGTSRTRRAELGRRFSAVATVGLGVVLATGLARGAAEVGAPANLLHTSFGRVLLVKLALFAGLALLGARNHFVLVPELGRSDDATPRFRRAVRGELVLGASILAVTGLLGGLATGKEAAAAAGASATPRVVLSGSDYATTVRVRLTVTPGKVGRNRFTLSASAYSSSRPLTGVRAVELDFSLPGQITVQPSTLILSRGPGGTWTGSGYELSVEGRWSIQVLVQQTASAVVVPLTMRAT